MSEGGCGRGRGNVTQREREGEKERERERERELFNKIYGDYKAKDVVIKKRPRQ